MFYIFNLFIASALLLRFASGEKSPVISKLDISALTCSFENLTQTLFEFKRRPQVINFGLDTKILDEIILKKLRQKNVPVQLENRSAKDAAELLYRNANESAFMTFDSTRTFYNFFIRTSFINNYFTPLLFYIYAFNASYNDFEVFKHGAMSYRNSRRGNLKLEIELMEMKNYIYFVVDEGNSIRLLTFIWHMPNRCNELQLIEVNRFDKVLRKWKNSVFEMQKYENFHGCQLVIGVQRDYPAFWLPDGFGIYNYGDLTYGGYNFEMIEGLAKNLNFTIAFNPLFPNGTYAKILPTDFKLIRGSYNFHRVHWNIEVARIFLTRPYIYTRVAMAVPPGASYNGYEKLLLPFDEHTWLWILFTFFIAFLTVLVVNFTKRSIRDLVFGSKITTPSLNIAAHFFGISQSNLPREYFSRILLTIFIFYCLIIRTAWQGKMFEFMQRDMRRSELISMEEMIEKNFSFCMWPSFKEYFSNMDLVKRYETVKLSFNY